MRWKKQKKIRRGLREGKEKHRTIRVGSVHVGTEGSPAGSQSNKVVRGCFAGCKFNPCGLSVSILLLFPLCNCELSLCTSFRDTRKWPCSRSPIHNPLYLPLLLFRVSPFRQIIHSDPFQSPIVEDSLSHGIHTISCAFISIKAFYDTYKKCINYMLHIR